MRAKCTLCHADATIQISWATSMGPQSANFCKPASDYWWQTYKNTPSGLGAMMGPPEHNSETVLDPSQKICVLARDADGKMYLT